MDPEVHQGALGLGVSWVAEKDSIGMGRHLTVYYAKTSGIARRRVVDAMVTS